VCTEIPDVVATEEVDGDDGEDGGGEGENDDGGGDGDQGWPGCAPPQWSVSAGLGAVATAEGARLRRRIRSGPGKGEQLIA
jgi:hypothetical protein